MVPGIFHSIHYTNSSFNDLLKPKSKADICKELGVEFFIDDSTHNAMTIADIGKKVFLLDSPWNQDPVNHSNIQRVHSWGEIVGHIEKAI